MARGVEVEGFQKKTDREGGVQWAIGRAGGAREDRTAGQAQKAENQGRSLERAVQELGVVDGGLLERGPTDGGSGTSGLKQGGPSWVIQKQSDETQETSSTILKKHDPRHPGEMSHTKEITRTAALRVSVYPLEFFF